MTVDLDSSTDQRQEVGKKQNEQSGDQPEDLYSDLWPLCV